MVAVVASISSKPGPVGATGGTRLRRPPVWRRIRPTNFSLRTKTIIAYLLMIVVAATSSAVVLRVLAIGTAANDQVTHIGRNIAAAEALLETVVDAETGVRGYLITGDVKFLEPYTAGISRFPQILRDIEARGVPPAQADRLKQIQILFLRWRSAVAEPQIAARKASPLHYGEFAQEAYTTALIMRQTAMRYAVTRSAADLAQWNADFGTLRQAILAILTLIPPDAGDRGWRQALALADGADRAVQGGATDRIGPSSSAIEAALHPLAQTASALDAELIQITLSGSGKALTDEIRKIKAAFDESAQRHLEQRIGDARAPILWARLVALAGPGLLVIMLLAALLVSTRTVESVQAVAQATKALAAGDLSRRVQVGSADEVGVMATAFNTMAGRMEAQFRGVELLSRMSELLQASFTVDEASAVIGQFGNQLFPGMGGGIFLINPSRDGVHLAATWGGELSPLGSSGFPPEDCWALRRGQTHQVDDTASGLCCRHLPTPPPAAYICIPLAAQGETLGILHLSAGAPRGQGTLSAVDETMVRLAHTVADQIALAVANLRLRETLRSQSIRDPLTGLYNRRYLEETLERELHRAERTRGTVGIVMFDIDLFKTFNDTFGHDAGDALLRELAALLRSQFRQEDIACRYGGEEFLLILPDASLEDTRTRAEALREAVATLSVSHRGQALGSVTISLGIAAFPEHGLSGETLLRAADGALYRAKRNGRGRLEVAV